MTTGIVFNIQRFSIHDGPGIRTTVFLKGCMNRCSWCHNPEGLNKLPQIQYEAAKCINCGNCVKTCPEYAHSSINGIHVFDRCRCRSCGKCADECHAGALHFCGRKVTAFELLDVVLEDKVFFEESGGGITLSGGEPFMQAKFVLDFLKLCKQNSINTALETSANCKWENIESALPFVDLMLLDVKHMDAVKHKTFIGTYNTMILNNIPNLMESNVAVVFRITLIPGFNDSEKEFSDIVKFIKKMATIRAKIHNYSDHYLPHLEILAYHKLAKDKYTSLGMDYPMLDAEPASQLQIKRLLAISEGFGIDSRLI